MSAFLGQTLHAAEATLHVDLINQPPVVVWPDIVTRAVNRLSRSDHPSSSQGRRDALYSLRLTFLDNSATAIPLAMVVVEPLPKPMMDFQAPPQSRSSSLEIIPHELFYGCSVHRSECAALKRAGQETTIRLVNWQLGSSSGRFMPLKFVWKSEGRIFNVDHATVPLGSGSAGGMQQ